MNQRIGLEPVWVEDLLGLWAGASLRQASEALGFSAVSPMFRRCASDAEAEDVQGYSSAELRALSAAVERLRLEYPLEWAAIQRGFKPWTRSGIDGTDDVGLLKRAGARLAGWVDAAVGGNSPTPVGGGS